MCGALAYVCFGPKADICPKFPLKFEPYADWLRLHCEVEYAVHIPTSVLDLARTAAANWNGKRVLAWTEVRNPLFPVQSLRPHSYDRNENSSVPTGNRAVICLLTLDFFVRSLTLGPSPAKAQQVRAMRSPATARWGSLCKSSLRCRLAGSRTPQMSDVRSADVAHSN
jgi:hypothetical protein